MTTQWNTIIRWKSKIQNPKSNQRTQSTHEQYSKKTLAAKNANGQKYHYQL